MGAGFGVQRGHVRNEERWEDAEVMSVGWGVVVCCSEYKMTGTVGKQNAINNWSVSPTICDY